MGKTKSVFVERMLGEYMQKVGPRCSAEKPATVNDDRTTGREVARLGVKIVNKKS